MSKTTFKGSPLIILNLPKMCKKTLFLKIFEQENEDANKLLKKKIFLLLIILK
jgi:hypothetical protein